MKEREAVIIRAPKQRGLVACDLNPGLPEGFQQGSLQAHEGGGHRALNPGLPEGLRKVVYRPHVGRGWGGGAGHRVCDPLCVVLWLVR